MDDKRWAKDKKLKTEDIKNRKLSAHLHVVVREAGERTADACCAELVRQVGADRVSRVSLTPFWSTLREGLRQGHASGADWVMSVDADVLPTEDAVARVTEWATRSAADVGVLSGMIQDKFMAGIRYGGIRLYRSEIIPKVLDLIPVQGETVRPESTALTRLVAEGWRHELVPELVGLHDYEQYYRDIYRKAFLHMRKHGARAARFLELWLAHAAGDEDFRVALAGAADAWLWPADVDCDASHTVYRNADTLTRLGLQEKNTYVYKAGTVIEEIAKLRSNLDAGIMAPVSPAEHEAYNKSQPQQVKVDRVVRMGDQLKQLAADSDEVRSAIVHQIRRAVPDAALLGGFSRGELIRQILCRRRR